MRFTVADLFVFILVLSLFAGANTIEQNGAMAIQADFATAIVPYTYYGFPWEAYRPPDWILFGTVGNTVITLGVATMVVLLLRKIRRTFFSPSVIPSGSHPNA